MRRSSPRFAAACVAVIAATGCGSSAPAKPGPDPNDKRAVALDCIVKRKKIPARTEGDNAIEVEGTDEPRIEFFTSTGEAEGRQFSGGAQSAEQIGASLLFVRGGSDMQLDALEDCLNEQ